MRSGVRARHRAWQRLPVALRRKIVSPHTFRGRALRPEDGVGWGVFGFLRPETVARLVAHLHACPQGRVFVLVPAPAVVRQWLAQPRAWYMARRVPWWQRVALAAGLRMVSAVVPVRSLDERAWMELVQPAAWLGCLEDWQADPPNGAAPARVS